MHILVYIYNDYTRQGWRGICIQCIAENFWAVHCVLRSENAHVYDGVAAKYLCACGIPKRAQP